MTNPPPDSVRHAAWAAVSAAFGSLGRFCMALDADFRVRHVSERIDLLLGEGAKDSLLAQPIERIPQVKDVITAGDFYDLSVGAQIIFT